METLASIHHAESYENTARQPLPFKKKVAKKPSTTGKGSSQSIPPAPAAPDLHGWVMPWMP